ncbi:hypothetical protein Ae201684P_003785 [Aphanomyces euteiches]|uniref:Uncharacterized protein n=1 Tax=Aphanomyces euteiches TaxID=100861 RepID=A0A6G0XT13_9STRA|nr:hypothetical protein Ae201684_001714 [Aphanomyces euteiches]KAH9075100.1 hypothetical protein Ae201684P_003785 [Aphanomyces euteiches]
MATMARILRLVEDANAVVMDRLSHRTHWKNPADVFECHLCKTLFHWNPKTNCAFCGHVVCTDCSECVLVHGTMVNLRTGAVSSTSIETETCIGCFYTTFRLHATAAVVDGDDELNDPLALPPRPSVQLSYPSKPLIPRPPVPKPQRSSLGKLFFGSSPSPSPKPDRRTVPSTRKHWISSSASS